MKIPNALLILLLPFIFSCSNQPENIRTYISLNDKWKSIALDSTIEANANFMSPEFNDTLWENVNVPHNWDRYHGFLRKVHGNYHGTAWYRKSFTVNKGNEGQQYFLFFEGVGSYATVWLNGKKAGSHAGGRTTFTLNISDLIKFGEPNILAVLAEHPSEISDLPWVCGGCSTERGFSEGSQPMGIFRPVSLIVTNELRIEPFGIHIWNDTTANKNTSTLNITTELKNYGTTEKTFTIQHTLHNAKRKIVAETESKHSLPAGKLKVFDGTTMQVNNPELWSTEHPYLYTLETTIIENNTIIDQVTTPYGIRTISWPVNRNDSSGLFLVNDQPVFINGIGEYEHMFGNSHAFTRQQIEARVAQIQAAGFNAFRDAHQPHNLYYQQLLDEKGILWWTQFSAHIWYDNPEFRDNFKSLLREWVKERRNNPSNIVWGLQNESTLPTDFSQECVNIIREMDPTASSQRIVTTCNGGTGTDWNVVQNWSGTYGGNPDIYDQELSVQLLNGEYGAWRSLDLHSEGPYQQNGTLSEDRMTQLLQTKARLAESVSNKVCGQFLWIFSSHDNPGRIQSGEALRDIDRVGPVNYKGLFTPWGEPLDVFYMYRSHYVSAKTEPMVYIVSHTWPNRWTNPGVKDSITVYSNCDEVELFNGIDNQSLGKIKSPGFGLPFLWKKADVHHNLLHAVGYVNGEPVAEDIITLMHLPESPEMAELKIQTDILQAQPNLNYLYRVNCGGDTYTDALGNTWLADRPLKDKNTWGSTSWVNSFSKLPDLYGSQRRTFDPISGTADWELFQNFRYGMKELAFHFPVPDGKYQVELYFTEPWYGTGGGMNCKDWRVFDVAVNNQTVINNLDIWSESGHDKVLKKVIQATAIDGKLTVHFPEVISGQAIISAIAIATKNMEYEPVSGSELVISDLKVNVGKGNEWQIKSWLDWGDQQYTDSEITLNQIPSILFGATWLQTPHVAGSRQSVSFKLNSTSDVFISLPMGSKVPAWMKGYIKLDIVLKNDSAENNQFDLYSTRFKENSTIRLGTLDASENYNVFVVPANKLDAPSDQRPVTYYNVKDAKISGPLQRRLVDGRHYLEFTGNSTATIEWTFQVGLASTYGVHFKFQNNTGDDVHCNMLIESANGIEMRNSKVEMYNKPGKWRTVKTSTGTTVNAGTYKVKLTFENNKGLLLQRMEIQ